MSSFLNRLSKSALSSFLNLTGASFLLVGPSSFALALEEVKGSGPHYQESKMPSDLRGSCVTGRFWVTLSLILLPLFTTFSSSVASPWVHSPHRPTFGEILEEDFILRALEWPPLERSLSLLIEMGLSHLLHPPPSPDKIMRGWLGDLSWGAPGVFWYP